ncbi:SDR family NAD(P)-dependent oxidoreductase [Stenotrophobium rhamnosiphilum]|uniref:Short-chain dehydrogenase n=1 Tax=Stenotrophobium rhamnosiphilum TaxID=2029166 RepID=A0A2T5MH69_9GAMM|nr:SDR family NAD(P)-dependent oxidoreductase [Stenotrophobium rhamnosiphilum]PTU31889.1 short-chain dehydrogenase [Stenotrophobium rhamnosiphilum]
MSLQGKVAVVTGGARGIGRAISKRLARDGAAVSVWDLRADGLNETVEEIRNAGGKALACIGDAANAGEVARCASETRQAFGSIHILVNNAGIVGFDRFMTITEEMWDRMMLVNMKGPFLCTKEIIPDMLAAKWGRIVNISSSSAQTGAASMSHYVASKGGLIGLTKGLAIEFASTGITVNNVPPGFVDTPMLRESPVNIEAHALTTPMKRSGCPEDIAAAVAYLASEDANYVTGQTLSVNGGRFLS